MSRPEYDDGDNVLIEFHSLVGETEDAYCVKVSAGDGVGVWIPKSQVKHVDWDNTEMWIPLWLAEKKEMEYK